MMSEVVDDWLKSNGKSREWLAAAIGRSLSTLMRVLEAEKPPRTNLLAISHITGIPEDQLLGKRTHKRHKEAVG